MSTGESIADLRRPWWANPGAVNVLTLLGVVVPAVLLVAGLVVGQRREPNVVTAGNYRSFQSAEYASRGYVLAGQLFDRDGGGDFKVSERFGFIAVRLPGSVTLAGFEPGTFVAVNDGEIHVDYAYAPTPDSVPRIIELSIEVPSEPRAYREFAFSGTETRPAVEATGDLSHPELIIQARNRQSGYLHPIGIDTRGRLWVDLQPVESRPFDLRTGRAIDESNRFRFGRVVDGDLVNPQTVCAGEVCETHFNTGGQDLLAPMDGTIGCFGSPRVFKTRGYELRFWTAGVPQIALNLDCDVTSVAAGDRIGDPGEYVVTVSGNDHSATFIADNGALWAGNLVDDATCPCRDYQFADFPRD